MHWMKAILATLSGIALIAFTFLCLTVASAVHTNSKHVAQFIMSANDTIEKTNATLDKINGKGGMLQQSAETIVRVKDLITLSQATLYKQQTSLDLWNKQIGTTLSNVNIALANAAIDENTLSTAAISTMATTTNTLVDAQADIKDGDATVKALTTTLVSANQTVADADATVLSLKATAVDLQEEVHKLTHPTKKKLGFWGTVWAGAQIIHKLSPPLF